MNNVKKKNLLDKEFDTIEVVIDGESYDAIVFAQRGTNIYYVMGQMPVKAEAFMAVVRERIIVDTQKGYFVLSMKSFQDKYSVFNSVGDFMTEYGLSFGNGQSNAQTTLTELAEAFFAEMPELKYKF
jgi:hypothetical protein